MVSGPKNGAERKNADHFPPLSEFGFLSDCHTAALVGADGAVEWMCTPQFDGASIFARILDRDRGGAWELDIPGAKVTERRYLRDSLVLRTQWKGEDTHVTAHDFLAVTQAADSDELTPVGRFVRMVRCDSGRALMRSRLDAKPDDARRAARWQPDGIGASEESGVKFAMTSPWDFDAGVPVLGTTLDEGDVVAMFLDYTGTRVGPVTTDEAQRLLDQSWDASRRWSEGSDYDGPGAEHLRHSALVLRGLLFDENDGLVAAPTSSLPEWPGGRRNWDYRYVWLRDASLVVLALLRLGHDDEAGRYLRFLLQKCAKSDDWLPPVFAIDGGDVTGETHLDHLTGYAHSQPVRRGNAAVGQHQLDVYGHVLDAACAFHEVTGKLTDNDLSTLWRVVDSACRHWRAPDAGVWEVRGTERHWTHSKVYAWVCLDRAIRIADLTGDSRAPVLRWRRERDLVRESILAHGYDGDAGTFVQAYGSTAVDASLVRIPLVRLLDGDDPRVVRTLDRIDAELGDGNGLVHRYNTDATDDGVHGPEGAFLKCSFDMVAALVLAGRSAEAEQRFRTLAERASPLGLYAEQMTSDGTMLGNFPQAFTHLALIEAALNLHEAGRHEALRAWAEGHHGSR